MQNTEEGRDFIKQSLSYFFWKWPYKSEVIKMDSPEALKNKGYETFGEHQSAESGIFDFMRAFPDAVLADGEFGFGTPATISAKFRPVAELDVPEIISWADEERDVTAWLGNELQQDAYNKIYGLYEKVALANQPSLWTDYGHLQESDHFYYMCTKFFSDGEVHKYFNPYDTPYEAFINYMNVLSDFTIRVNDALAVADVEEPSVKKPAAVKKASVRKAPAKRKTAVKK